jgi:hypothetical protein
MALDEPELVVSSDAPYLPPSAPPKPAIARPLVFDAKAMVDSTKRKVENPVYGHMPTGTPEGRAAADAARARMRRKRHRNKIIGWAMLVAFVAVVCGVSYALYNMYQDDQAAQRAEREARAQEDAAAGAAGALSPLGEQAVAAEGLGDANSGPVAGGRAATQAIDQAQQAADAANGQPASSAIATVDDVLPPAIAAVATELQPRDGLTRYMIERDDAIRADPLGTPGWIDRLKALPQAPESSPGLTLVPAVGPGEIAIALQTDGDQVTRLVVLSLDPALRVDL